MYLDTELNFIVLCSYIHVHISKELDKFNKRSLIILAFINLWTLLFEYTRTLIAEYHAS